MLNKPPIGIKPKYIHDKERHNDLKMAIARYLNEDMALPEEWITEYNHSPYTVDRAEVKTSYVYPKGFVIVEPYRGD
jgi:hypothetical protein